MPGPRHDGGRTGRQSRLRLKIHFRPGLSVARKNLPYTLVLLEAEQ